jgi:hypothetical protein
MQGEQIQVLAKMKEHIAQTNKSDEICQALVYLIECDFFNKSEKASQVNYKCFSQGLCAKDQSVVGVYCREMFMQHGGNIERMSDLLPSKCLKHFMEIADICGVPNALRLAYYQANMIDKYSRDKAEYITSTKPPLLSQDDLNEI